MLQGTAAELDRLRCFGAWVQQRASHVKSFTFVVMGELPMVRHHSRWQQEAIEHLAATTGAEPGHAVFITSRPADLMAGATIDVEVDEEAAAHQQEVWSTLEGGVLASLAAAGSIAELNLEW